jgi:hypothetical protein
MYRLSLSPDELLRYADEHLLYEIDMLNKTAKFYPGCDQVVINMRIESFGAHLRNLIDFFYNNTPRSDDVVATDFFSDESAGMPLIPIISETLNRAKIRVGKELGHLTTKRIHGYAPEKEWDFAGLTNEINALLKVFILHARMDVLSNGFKNYIVSLRF